VILIGTAEGIMRVPADGGALTAVTAVDTSESAHRFPTFLPDGRRFLYLRGGAFGSRYIAVGDLNAAPSEQSTTPILKTDLGALAVPAVTGGPLTLLFQRAATVFAQDFDGQTLALTGEPVALVERVTEFNPAGLAYFSASNTGTLVYRTIAGDNRQLTWFDRDGKVAGTPGEPGPYGLPHVSPDGTKAAVVPRVSLVQQPVNNDVWIIDLVKNVSRRFTFDPDTDIQPVWSPDGKWIAWQSFRNKEQAFYRKASDGSGVDERLSPHLPVAALTGWTSNGYLVYTHKNDIWAQPVEPDAAGDRTPVTVVAAPGDQYDAQVSPDSRWIAYISSETGRPELFVQPFTAGRAGAAPVGKWQVSPRGTMGAARWRADGKELVFLNGEGMMVAVDIVPGAAFQASAPRVLFQMPLDLNAVIVQSPVIDAARDNQRFLVSMPVQESSQREIGVFVNWASALQR
jgi:Tol biopolymer transport system component